MPKHDQYEELCTLAIIGEVSPAEMHDLRLHLRDCSDCREQYREFTQFLLPQLYLSNEHDMSCEAGYSPAEATRLRGDFLAAAQKKGLVFSRQAVGGQVEVIPSTAPPTSRIALCPPIGRWAIAASIATLIFASGYGLHRAVEYRAPAALSEVTAPVAPPPAAVKSEATPAPAIADLTDELQETKQADAKTIETLQQKLTATLASLEKAQNSVRSSEVAKADIEQQLSQKEAQLNTLRSQAQNSEQGAEELHFQVAQLQQRIVDSQAAVAANEIHVRDLNERLASQSASLDRERQMLSAGRDVRDLMGARNLHIIDVHDSNGTGKNKKAFGRIFYTEGKSLIFYAFDLDEQRVTNASYSFEAWGERLGQPGSIKSLGVLFSDDKAQRRWSLKVDDPHQLSEINSVFVTLEPREGDSDKPKGKKILFAFLGGDANHP